MGEGAGGTSSAEQKNGKRETARDRKAEDEQMDSEDQRNINRDAQVGGLVSPVSGTSRTWTGALDGKRWSRQSLQDPENDMDGGLGWRRVCAQPHIQMSMAAFQRPGR